jgi:hypothetical protein
MPAWPIQARRLCAYAAVALEPYLFFRKQNLCFRHVYNRIVKLFGAAKVIKKD